MFTNTNQLERILRVYKKTLDPRNNQYLFFFPHAFIGTFDCLEAEYTRTNTFQGIDIANTYNDNAPAFQSSYNESYSHGNNPTLADSNS